MKIFHYKDSDYSGMKECTKISRKILDLIHKTTFFVRDYEHYNNTPSHAQHYMGIICETPYPPPWNAHLAAAALMDKHCGIKPALPIVVAPEWNGDKYDKPTITIYEAMYVADEEKNPFYELEFSSNDEMFKWMSENMTNQVVDNRDIKVEFEKKTGKSGVYFHWGHFRVYGIH